MTASPSRTLRILLLATTLLVAQWVLVQHETQLELHASHASCEWCLSHSPLAGALPQLALVFEPAAPEVFASGRGNTSVIAPFVPAYVSRAPPATLSLS